MTVMEDDGPKPMRNMRPAKKQRTGADKFYRDHQDYYDRSYESKDRSQRVRMHNNAYPKLIDELERRRSVARPAKSANRRPIRSRAQLCYRCLQSFGQKTRRYRYQRPSNRRIMKPKQRQRAPRRYRKAPKITKSRGCQYFYRAPLETKSVSTYDDISIDSENMAGSSRNCENRKLGDKDVDGALAGKRSSLAASCGEKRKSEMSHNARTNPPSLSSYNSFASMDHEPMVD